MASSRTKTWWIVGAIVVVIVLWAGATYNTLITKQETNSATWAQIETQYQRRLDLVPNLVNTVRGSADFEQSTLEGVTEARTRWLNAGGNRGEQIAAANEFESALSRLLVTVESYPQLQSTQAFQGLMTQLEGTENRIATARRDYNEAVRSYNLTVKRFPGSMVAMLFSFDEAAFFEAAEGADQAPTVDFDFDSE